MSSYTPRKGSLGFRFKRIKKYPVNGGNKLYLWFHKVGIDHNTDVNYFEPRTHLELIDTTIKGYVHKKQSNKMYTLEEVKEKNIPSEELHTVLQLKPRFRKTSLKREIGYIESIDELYNLLDTPKLKVTSVTKGKGYSGVIKTRGIKLGKRKRARSNKERHVGAIGGRTGHVSWRAPQSANMGFAKRTYMVYKASTSIEGSLNFFRYGYTQNRILSIRGSIPGNIKEIVRICLKR